MKKDKLLVCTFSGGRTSAFMAQFLNTFPKYDDYDKAFIFANTGKEREETLEFIDKCDKEWGLGIVWLEANINKEKFKGTTYKIVDFKSASRKGEPFEAMLKKYPLPTNYGSVCTRELKLRPLNKYIKDLNYKEFKTALGIRFDERHRKSLHAEADDIIYPLCDDIKVDSKFIRTWWDMQCFDLQLKDYEGNCDLCFKKSVRKRLTIIKENPKVAEWWNKMEKKYAKQYPRFDLRTNKSVEDLIKMSKEPFRTIADKHETEKRQISLFDVDMDVETDCFCKAT
tara:strand:+ start:178 stop:1026 length:849 start_codon:yes stop_codon:yes gene_type:complete